MRLLSIFMLLSPALIALAVPVDPAVPRGEVAESAAAAALVERASVNTDITINPVALQAVLQDILNAVNDLSSLLGL